MQYGRNLVYFLREGYEVYAADADPQSVEGVREIARMFAPALPASNFRVEPVEQMSFDDACADVVVSNAVLHFARDDAHFEKMLRGSWRVLKPGGLFFCRLASTIGMEEPVQARPGTPLPVAGRHGAVPGGRTCLTRWADWIGGELAEPLKTTVVQDQRAMTTWVLRKKLQ